MKKLTIILIAFLAVSSASFGQSSVSDILYIKAKNVDRSYIGKFAHLDFNKTGGSVNDTVVLTVNNTFVPFVSHRLGNGQDNLFYGQYLESVGYVNGYTVRLVKSRIDNVDGDYIQLTNFFDFYGKDHALAAGKSIQEQYRVAKQQVGQVLLKVDKGDM
jgi:hypothetical protein